MLRRLNTLTTLALLSVCLTLLLTACGEVRVRDDSLAYANMEDKLNYYSKVEAQHLSGYPGNAEHVNIGGKSGCCLLACDYPGNGWFAMRCYEEHGEYLGALLYQPGPYTGTTTSLVACGTDLIIEGDSEWSVDVLPLSSMTKAGNGDTFHGDDVVYIDVDEVSEVSFSHDSEGAFSVKGVPFDSEGIRIPVTFDQPYGAISFTEPWTYGQAVFVVEAAGDWTISWK